jgi:RNA polymerase sigma factor (sigma-70 family)
VSDPVFPPTEAASRTFASPLQDEAMFFLNWDDDIERAASFSAVGFAEPEDLAQMVRMRLLVVHRRFPDLPAAYLRAVIANTLRSALRDNARRFTTQSPLAQTLTENLELQVDTSIETIFDVRAWTSRLPRRLRDVYRHVYAEGRSQREAAEVMKITQPRVAQLHRQLLAKGHQELAALAA